MNILDIAFVIIIGFFLVRGLFKGMISEIASVAGLICGFIVAGRYADQFEPHLSSVVNLGQLSGAVAYLILFVGVMLVSGVLAAGVSRLLDSAGMGWLNRLLGGALGGGKGALLCCILLALANHFTPDAAFLRGSVVSPYLEDVTGYLRGFLPDQGF